MNKTNSQCVETQMLIRKPVSQVFEAFIDPSIKTMVLIKPEMIFWK
jgi:hypothetical protein